jgi:50S ribosomal subunit-associated GTPase HflX
VNVTLRTTRGAQPLAVSADRSSVETSTDDLAAELAKLQAAEARLSAERSRLQDQIDFGFATSTSREREREVSDERRQVHERIDALRRQLQKH